MAYFFRLIKRRIAYIIAGLLVGFFVTQCNQAFASQSPALQRYQVQDFGFFSTESAACLTSVGRASSGGIIDNAYLEGGFCKHVMNYGSTFSRNIQVEYYCANGTSPDGSNMCTAIECTPPQVLNSAGSACETPNNCANLAGELVNKVFTNNGSSTICKVGCEMTVIDQVCLGGSAAGEGCSSTVKLTGNTCTATPDVPEPVPTDPKKECLANGNSYGEINGILTCVKNGTNGTPPLTTKSNGDKTVTNANGSTSTITTTSTNNNTVTTTTITTNPDGSTSNESKEQDKQGFCEENPTSKVCKDEEKSTFGGTCSSSFTCEGDAIQCATAKRIQQNKCDYDKEKQDLEDLPAYEKGQKLLNGEYDQDVQDFMNKEGDSVREVSLQNQLSESGPASFSGEGLTDVTYTVLGRTSTLPLSNYNQYLEIMGFVLLALSYFAAYKIIMGAT